MIKTNLNFKSFFKVAVLLLLILSLPSYSQNNGSVGIGTQTPNPSAILDISSSSKGLLIPRLTILQRNNIIKPAKGLIIYQTDGFQGLYIYNGSSWVSSGYSSTESFAKAAVSTTWNTTGNQGLTKEEHFLGTTDTSALQFKVNSIQAGLIDFKSLNTTLGYGAGKDNLGSKSVILGAYALQNASIGTNNIAIGYQSQFENLNGDFNVAVGSSSLSTNVLGEKNTAIGSLSGFNSVGSGNIFLGYQSGYFETADNKLVIGNNAYSTPIIYGDMESNFLSINSEVLGYPLSINSDIANTSGLQFQNLSSNSPTEASNGKVLSLNNKGEVILVNDLKDNSGDSYWTLADSSMQNSNLGGIIINNGLEVKTGNLKLTNLAAASENTDNKVLSLDKDGNISLVDQLTGTTSSTTSPWVENSDHVALNSDKKVVIGTAIKSIPGNYNLYVSGGILAERVRVAVPNADKWADYVFEKNYKLLPLNEVEKYVIKNKHLPNIPSAKELAQNGLDMVEINAKLMEKIEELTLYMIEADKKITTLQDQVAKLAK